MMGGGSAIHHWKVTRFRGIMRKQSEIYQSYPPTPPILPLTLNHVHTDTLVTEKDPRGIKPMTLDP